MGRKVLSAVLLLINSIMVLYALNLAYFYFFTDVLFAFKLPNWLLISYALIGAWGFFVDIKLFKNKFTIQKALLLDLAPKLALFFLEYALF